MQIILVTKGPAAAETRAAATPQTVKRYVDLGFAVHVERDAGAKAWLSNEAYEAAGATIVDVGDSVAKADLVFQFSVPTAAFVATMKEGATLVSFLWAAEHLDVVEALRDRRISAFSMDAIPRITRAQKCDARSSQANIAGYKAVLVAATHLPKVLPLLMTAAGTSRPAKVVVIGGGVAGLQAVATAKRLGAVVELSDVRPEVKEQAKSLGATYIEVESSEQLGGEDGYAKEQSEAFRRRQQEVLESHLVAADIIICTALIPYRPAPRIVSEAVVEKMRDGSVIVDLAAERGGNCECTVSGEVVRAHGVVIDGTFPLASTVPGDATEMYANNIRNLITDHVTDEGFAWNLEDDIVEGGLITHDGAVLDARVASLLEPVEE